MTVAPHVFLGLNALGQWMLDCSSEQGELPTHSKADGLVLRHVL